jgi:hypothetical protein
VSCDGCGKSYPSYYNYTRLELKRFNASLRIYHIVGRSYNARSNAFSRKSEKESVIGGENFRFKISIHFSPAVIAKKFAKKIGRATMIVSTFFDQTLPVGGMRPAVRRPVLMPVLLCTPPHTLRHQEPRQNDGRWPLL